MVYEIVGFIRMYSDDETLSRLQLEGGGFLIFNHMKRNTPVLSFLGDGDSWQHVYREEVEEVNIYQFILIFTLSKDNKRRRLLIELGIGDTIYNLTETWKKIMPPQKKLKWKDPVPFIVDWILKRNPEAKSLKKSLKKKGDVGKELHQYMTADDRECMKFLNQKPTMKQITQLTVIKLNERIYYSMYSNFVVQNPQKSKKELKAKLFQESNMPGFVKHHSSEANAEFLKFAIEKFILFHRCASHGCHGFSLEKCSSCKHAHYCNEECQEKDFETHPCEEHKQFRKTKILPAGGQLEKLLLERDMFKGKHLSFDEFVSIVDSKIFECSFNALDGSEFLPSFNKKFHHSQFCFIVEKQHLTPLLKGPTIPKELFLRQLGDLPKSGITETFGSFNMSKVCI